MKLFLMKQANLMELRWAEFGLVSRVRFHVHEDRKIEVWVFSRDFKTRKSVFGGFQFRLRETSETKMA